MKEKNSTDFDVILFHEDALNDKENNKIINNSNSLKVLVSSKKIVGVQIDPDEKTADVNSTNNIWPRKINETNFDKFRKRRN